MNRSKNINTPCAMFVSLVASTKNVEQEGLKGQLSPSRSDIRYQ
ncbi:MAG: hypothetical protein PVF17_11350 [Ignavibacteria bacterium]